MRVINTTPEDTVGTVILILQTCILEIKTGNTKKTLLRLENAVTLLDSALKTVQGADQVISIIKKVED